MYEYTCEIPYLTKSPNSHSNKSFWTKKYELKKWTQLIFHAFYKNKPEVPLQKVSLEIIRESTVQPDTDNMYASCKQLIDSLRINEIIANDAPKNLELKCSWQKGKKGKGKTILILKEIKEKKVA